MATKIPSLSVKKVTPLTDNQSRIFDAFNSGKHLFIYGSAGTGKTFVSLYLAFNELFNKPVCDTDVFKLVIIRSAVPTRDLGFLPGDAEEKVSIYSEPYRNITDNLFEREGMFDNLQSKGMLDFMSTSYIRGLTIDNSIVIFDEIQNANFHELDSVITRLGSSSRIIFCGDFFQTDLKREREVKGMRDFMNILKTLDDFETIELNESDIVRSGLVRKFIMQKNQYMKNGNMELKLVG
jgi:phosphate starvation-inducible protein PhoH